MNNERYNQIIDGAYENYEMAIENQRDLQRKEVERLRSQRKWVRFSHIELLSKEEFIRKCKTDSEFSKKWGLKIEERELSLDERHAIAFPIWKEKYGALAEMMVKTNVDNTPYNIPTKLITVTYKDEKIEVYE